VALYRVTIPKRFVTGDFTAEPPWRNVYTIEADSYASALAAGDIIAGHEMAFHMADVGVTEIVAHLVTEPARRVGKVLAVSRTGEIAFTTQLLPLWNCVRADFTDVGVGRPERKYYRPPLQKHQITGTVLEGLYLEVVQAGVNGIVALTNYVGPSGEQHDVAVVHSLVQMRQRNWHRRRRPGFVRGYVPV
jgi:hypothetical protein